MAILPNMGIVTDNYIGQSSPTAGPTWAAHLEAMKVVVDGHTHGPSVLQDGASICTLIQANVGSGPFTIPNLIQAISLVTMDTTAAAGTVTLNLPLAANSLGCILVVKDTGHGATRNTIVTRAGSDLVDSSSVGATISTNFGVVRLIAATAGQWWSI